MNETELLVLSLRSYDGTTILGEPTAGALSPILTRGLPNGWVLGLSNQRTLDGDGVLWEVQGVPPDEVVPVTLADLESGRDPVMERADEILGG